MPYTAKDLSPLVRGDDWSIKITLTTGGSALDITGYTFWFTLKANADDADPGALQVTATPNTGGSPPTEAEQGIVFINVSRTLTDTVAPKTYFYDVQQVDGSGNVQTLLLGKVKVVKDITRTTSP